MNGRHWILLALAFSGCEHDLPAPVFQQAMGGVWKLKTSQKVAAASAPEPVRTMGTRGGWSATYEGPGSATVELYSLTAPGVGLELVQRWRPIPDAVVWNTPHYFVLVKWQSTERNAIKAFIRGLQQQFSEPP